MADTEVVAGAAPDAPLDADALTREAEGNAFERTMKSALRELDSARTPAKQGTSGKDGERAPEGSDAFSITDDDDEQAPKADAGKPGEATDDDGKDKTPKASTDAESEDGARGARFQLIGADGKPIPDGIKWPDGAKMRFTVNERPVTVKSLDHLVAMSQRGALADRHEARAARLTKDVDALSERVTKVNQVSQDVLLAALFGTEDRSADEIREALEKELEPYRNPEFRKGQEALRERAEAEAQDETASAEQAQERTATIWADADELFEESLPDFPYLEASDAVVVKSVLHQRYVRAHQQAVQDLAADAKAHRWTARQYAEAVESIASQTLSIENLRAVTQDLNHEYERRLKGKVNPPAKPSPSAKPALVADDGDEGEEEDKGEEIEAEATAHNAKTVGKLEQRERSRTLRGSGVAAVAGVRVPNLEGQSYEAQMAAMRKEMRSAMR